MLREFWNRLTGAGRAEAVQREVEREEDSPAEGRYDAESVEGHAADAVAEEHLGGFKPDELIED
jgi:hypothetical protein